MMSPFFFYTENKNCGKKDEGEERRQKKNKKENVFFNLLIPSLPIRSHSKQITQNAPLHTSVSLLIAGYTALSVGRRGINNIMRTADDELGRRVCVSVCVCVCV